MEQFKPELVAPCGMNCAVCTRYLAFTFGIPKQRGKVSHCAGCRPREKNCYIIRGCRKLRKGEIQFCYECSDMPCDKLKHLDKRYRERYATSLVANLQELKEKGISGFLKSQQERFRCPSCGGIFTVHGGQCFTCKQKTLLKPNF